MNVGAHFRFLTRELESLKDRVRNFNHTKHWQTDGEWKESVLRSTLRRYLPSAIEPLRGFVVTPNESTRQIDLLLYDSSKPVLFRDGDLVFVTGDAAMGIVEVKSRIEDRTSLAQALGTLSRNAELIRSSSGNKREIFVGLFAYDTSFTGDHWRGILEELDSACEGDYRRIVNHVCLGCSLFAKFWKTSPDGYISETPYDHWHAYSLENCAAGYFISNIIHLAAAESVSNNVALWFPIEGSEGHRLGRQRLEAHNTVGRADG